MTNIQLNSEEKDTSHSVVNIENAIAEIQIPNVEETPRNCHETCNSIKLDSSKARNTYSALLDVVPGESCPDRSQNFAKLPEPIRSDENIISPHLPELNCSDDVTDVVPGEPCPDRRQDADKLPEPIRSDENIIYPHLPELSCSDDVANSSYIPEPIRSDGNINSPHIADDISNSTVYTDFSGIPADDNTNFPSRINTTEELDTPVDVSTQDEVHSSRPQQLLSNSRLESFWLPSTNERPPNFACIINNSDNDYNQSPTCSHEQVQDSNVPNPDQVAHTLCPSLVSSQRAFDTENTCLVRGNTFTERSLETELTSCLPVSLPAISDLPGFDTLDQDTDAPPVLADDHTYQQSQHWAPTGNNSISPSTWYTPSGDEPMVNAMTSPLKFPPESLYVIGSILDKTSQMLVDTGASVSAVSSSFFASLSPRLSVQSSHFPNIRTVSGEELPVEGKVTLV